MKLFSPSSFLGKLCLAVDDEWVGDKGKVRAFPGAGLVGCDQWLIAPIGKQ